MKVIGVKHRVRVGLGAPPVPETPTALFDTSATRQPVTVACPVCNTKRTKQAHPKHAVCSTCAANPDAVAERMGISLALAHRDRQKAAQTATAALAALTEQERERFDAYMTLRLRADSGDDTLTEGERRKLAVTNAAYTDANDARISDALRTAWTEHEACFWQSLAYDAKLQDRDRRLALLGVCLEDLGRQMDADALYALYALREVGHDHSRA